MFQPVPFQTQGYSLNEVKVLIMNLKILQIAGGIGGGAQQCLLMVC